MATFLTDFGDGYSGGELAAHADWVNAKVDGSGHGPYVDKTNTPGITGSASGFLQLAALCTAISPGPAQYARIRLLVIDPTFYHILHVRASGSGGTFTNYEISTNGTNYYISKIVNDSSTNLTMVNAGGSEGTFGATLSPDDILEARVSGSTIYIVVNDVVIDSAVDASSPISSGTGGLGLYPSGTTAQAFFTDFGFGDLPAGSEPTISSSGDASHRIGETNVPIAGSQFGSPQSSGFVKICPTNDIDDVDGVEQTATSWADGAIQYTVSGASLPLNQTVYLFVQNSLGSSNASGFPIVILPSAVVALSGSQGEGGMATMTGGIS